jgi:hypothetical protein
MHGLTHSSMSQLPSVSIATTKRVTSTRAVRHHRAGHHGGVGKCSVPDVDEDQLHWVIIVGEGQPASTRVVVSWRKM